MIAEIRRELEASVDLKYWEFQTGLIPGVENMMGVRMPKIRQIAKAAAKMDWKSEWELLNPDCYEEVMIKGILIGYGKLDRDEQAEFLQKFVPLIDNWAVCDGCCSTWKFMKQEEDFWFSFLEPYFSAKRNMKCGLLWYLCWIIL